MNWVLASFYGILESMRKVSYIRNYIILILCTLKNTHYSVIVSGKLISIKTQLEMIKISQAFGFVLGQE